MTEGRILVIDDSEFVLARVKSVLSQAGYEVQTTTQTVGAGRYLRTCDLVLLDFHMPGIDGGMVLESLKSAAQSSSSPCAFYLFTSDEEVATRYVSLGFDGVIRNKGELDALAGQVRAAFRMKKMRQIARRNKPDSNTGSSAPPPGEADRRPLSTLPPAFDPGSPGKTPPPPAHLASEALLGGRSGTTPVPGLPSEGPKTGAHAAIPRRRLSPARGMPALDIPSPPRPGASHREPSPAPGDEDDATADLPRTPT